MFLYCTSCDTEDLHTYEDKVDRVIGHWKQNLILGIALSPRSRLQFFFAIFLGDGHVCAISCMKKRLAS